MQNSLAVTLTRRFRSNDNILTRSSLLLDASLILFGSLLVALLAQIRILLPFTPVPITGQTLAVLLIGAVLGSRRGAATIGLYILEGGIGLPFFAGGTAGLAVLLGPTGGYLIGFAVAAYLVGWLAERGLDRRLETAVLAFALGTVCIYLFGTLGLLRFMGAQAAIAGGVLPFIVGDVLKAVLAGGLLPAAWKLVGNLK